MSRLALRFAGRATGQIEGAIAWWRENRHAAPDLLVEEFGAAIALLRESPGIGAPYPDAVPLDVRRFLLRRTRFHVYYTVRDETLVVLALWSAVRGHGPPLGHGGR